MRIYIFFLILVAGVKLSGKKNGKASLLFQLNESLYKLYPIFKNVFFPGLG